MSEEFYDNSVWTDYAMMWAENARDIIKVFNEPEGAEVQLFVRGNSYALEQFKQDYQEMTRLRRTETKVFAVQTESVINYSSRPEARKSKLVVLFQVKFKNQQEYFTETKFALSLHRQITELLQKRSQLSKLLNRTLTQIPIVEQWKEYLIDVCGGEVQTETWQRKEKKPPQEQPNTFCNSMPLSIPKEHFKGLTDKKSKNGEPFLTNQQFDLFIERAFCGTTEIPKQKMNQAPKGEKLLIQALFYEFYENYCFDYFQTMQCQDEFIKVLTNNFQGWDFQKVKNNFTPKTKKRL